MENLVGLLLSRTQQSRRIAAVFCEHSNVNIPLNCQTSQIFDLPRIQRELDKLMWSLVSCARERERERGKLKNVTQQHFKCLVDAREIVVSSQITTVTHSRTLQSILWNVYNFRIRFLQYNGLKIEEVTLRKSLLS